MSLRSFSVSCSSLRNFDIIVWSSSSEVSSTVTSFGTLASVRCPGCRVDLFVDLVYW